MTKDARPEISPYAIPNIALNFQGGSTLYIPAHLLTQIHKQGSMVPQQNTLQLTDVSADAGHVLVHYLFTGTYQCLRPKKSSVQDGLAAEFLTSVRIYGVAQTYMLQPLVELAKEEIQKLGKNLRTALIFDLIKDAYPSPRTDDIWLSSYLKAQVRLFLESPLKPLAEKKEEEQAPMSISDLLFKSMFELYHENTVSLREGQIQILRQEWEEAVREAEIRAEIRARNAEEQVTALAVAAEEEELEALKAKRVQRGGKLPRKKEERFVELQINALRRTREKEAYEAERAARDRRKQVAKETEQQDTRESEGIAKEAAELANQEEEKAKEAASIAEEEREIVRLLDKKNNTFMGLTSKSEQRLSQLQAKAMERAKEQAARKADHLAREAEEQAAREARKKATTIANPESTHWLHTESVETEALRKDKMIQKGSAPGGVELFDPWGIGKADKIQDDEIHPEAEAAQDTGINTSQNNVTNTEPLGAIKEKEKEKETNKKKNNDKSVAATNPTPVVSEGCLLEKPNQNTKDESNMEIDPWGHALGASKKGKAKNKKPGIKTSVSGSPSVDMTDAHNQEARADDDKMTRAEDEGWSFWGIKKKHVENNTATVDRETSLPLPLPPCDPTALGI